MMTRMNKLSIMLVTSIMKQMKKRGARDEPQLTPGSHPGGVFKQSYIITFQSSPVDIAKSIMKL